MKTLKESINEIKDLVDVDKEITEVEARNEIKVHLEDFLKLQKKYNKKGAASVIQLKYLRERIEKIGDRYLAKFHFSVHMKRFGKGDKNDQKREKKVLRKLSQLVGELNRKPSVINARNIYQKGKPDEMVVRATFGTAGDSKREVEKEIKKTIKAIEKNHDLNYGGKA